MTPYLSWCLTVRNSASKKMRGDHTFERTLQLLRERTPDAEIVVVDTCSSDDTVEVARRYADVVEVYRGPHGDWDEEMLAVPDMAAARTRAFEIASGTWRGWIDDDDALYGPDETTRLLRANGRWAIDEESAYREGSAEETVTLEEALRMVEERHPEVLWVWCPYLYRRDKNDHALVWQERERFIKWTEPPAFKWSEAAHEVLVPSKPGNMPPRIDFSHLLFVHEKDFSEEDIGYATQRHYDALLKQPRTTRRCIYLAAYASTLAPQREEEFVHGALTAAISPIDRYRAHVTAGNFARKRGLFHQALEHYGSAAALIPDMPDAHFRGAEMYIEQKNPPKAIEWLERGLVTRKGGSATEISPWRHEIYYPTLLACEYEKLADMQIEAGAHEAAEQSLSGAVMLATKVLQNEAVVGDEDEAGARRRRLANRLRSHKAMMALHKLWQCLIDNDEVQKAAALILPTPHLCEDHPLAIEIEKWALTVAQHEIDPARLYRTDEFGQTPTPDWAYSEPGHLERERIREIVAWITARAKSGPVTVLDYGCYDGVIGIPVLRECGDEIARYVGVDLDERALERFARVAQRDGFDDRTVLLTVEEWRDVALAENPDLIVFSEVIEHVPNVLETLKELRRSAGKETAFFITTPWGAFDDGHPPDTTAYGTARSHLGHLRAMTPRDVVTNLQDAGWRPVDLRRVHKAHIEQLHAWAVVKEDRSPTVAFAVRGALWDWNGRTLHDRGMGYSESAIVFLAEQLASEGHRAEVYGPVPEETVHAAVPYWRREKIRYLREDAKVIVSRAPAHCREIDRASAHKTEKILWLQDTFYPELDADPSLIDEYEMIVAVSEWHRELLMKSHRIPAEKLRVIPNWLPPGLYDQDPTWERDTNYFIYASSPDRGLVHLLRLWPRIRRIVPDARLDIFYGWQGCIALGNSKSDAWLHRFEATRREYDRLRWQEGIREVGMRPQAEIAAALRRSAAWVYPTDFHETFGTIAAQSRAAGAPPVCTALAGLNESAACEQAVLIDPEAADWEDRFLDGVEIAVCTPPDARVEMSREARRTLSQEAVMPLWREILK